MTTLKTNAIEPEGGTTNLTIGMTGQNVVIGGSGGIKANTYKDAGGNTLWISNGSGTLSSVSGFGGTMTLVTATTASSSASISFTLTNAYKEYHFEFISIDGSSDTQLQFQCTSDGSNYNVANTSAAVYARLTEGNTAGLSYYTGIDKAQATTFQSLFPDLHSGSDASICGRLQIYNPSDTTFAKHWQAKCIGVQSSPGAWEQWAAGYFNTTSALTGIQFKMSSGNFVDGSKIKMYGIK